MNHLVSIVVNNFNYGRYLRAAVESALRQEGCSVEVIVVDDGSTDGSRNVIESFGDRIQAIYKANGGQASAINTGAAAAQGDYVLLLDSDDVLRPRGVATALPHFEPGYNRVAWQLQKIDESGEPLPEAFHDSRYPGFDDDPIETYIRSATFPITPTSGNLFRASDLRAILPIPEQQFRISADVHILIAMGERGKTRVLDCILTDYRIHGDNHFSRNDFFDPQTIEAHLAGDISMRGLLEAAAQRRIPSFVAPPITERLATAVKLVLAKRMGVMPTAMREWPLARIARTYWAAAPAPTWKKAVGMATLAACSVLPLWLLKAAWQSQRRRGAPVD